LLVEGEGARRIASDVFSVLVELGEAEAAVRALGFAGALVEGGRAGQVDRGAAAPLVEGAEVVASGAVAEIASRAEDHRRARRIDVEQGHPAVEARLRVVGWARRRRGGLRLFFAAPDHQEREHPSASRAAHAVTLSEIDGRGREPPAKGLVAILGAVAEG